MKLRVDRSLCQSTGLCVGLAPEALDLDDDGRLVVLSEEPPADLDQDIRQAVLACPVQALSLAED